MELEKGSVALVDQESADCQCDQDDEDSARRNDASTDLRVPEISFHDYS